MGSFLVLYIKNYSSRSPQWTAAFWKLPSDFIKTCHRHLREGTVGSTSHYDQRFVEDYPDFDEKQQLKIDHLGFLKYCVSLETSEAVLRVAMLNNRIVLDEDNF